jgi:hypothetical protein
VLQRLLKRWPVRIYDNRGNLVPLIAPPRIAKHERTGWWKPKYTGGHAGHAADWEVQTRTAGLYGAFCGLSIVGSRPLSEYLLRNAAFPGKTYLVMVLTGLLCWPLFPFVTRFVRSSRRHQLRTAYLAAKHCPSCDYDLSQIPPQSIGTTTCPECGAEWNLGETRAP